MFRKIRRFKQEMPAEECRELLKTQVRGVLSLLGDGGYPYGVPSVIVFGRIAPVTDEAATALACKELSRKFTPDDEYFNKEYAAAKDRVLCLALTPEHITGKRIKEN